MTTPLPPERISPFNPAPLLDDGMETALDQFAKLAAYVMRCPMAVVSLVDHERNWWLARYGVEVPRSRDMSFCGHVIESSGPLVVCDTHADSRFAANPMVTGSPHVRFYAGVPLRNDDGVPLGTLCVFDHAPRTPSREELETFAIIGTRMVEHVEGRLALLDLTRERREARRAAARLESVFEAMAEGVVVQGATGEITVFNAAAERILGLDAEQLAGRTSLDPAWRTVREDGQPLSGDQHPAMVTLRTGQPIRDFVMGVQRPGGDLAWISVNSVPVTNTEHAPEVVTTFHDVTTLKQATERAVEQARLATAGTLAAGVGHEISNPLTYVLGSIDLAMEASSGEGGADIRDSLAEAKRGAERIGTIVHGLRALTREDVALQGVDVHGVIETSLCMAAHATKERAVVEKRLADVPPALGDESRLTQVLLNLVLNAGQAFESADLTKNRIVVSAVLRDDGRVAISVADNGPGIPAAVQQRIFDPFFTTKPVGQGTGLGLSVCRRILHSLGGEITVESVVGSGAKFTVLLPAAPSTNRSPSQLPGRLAQRARILVIDDELAVGNTIRRILSREHDVVTLDDPRQAMELLESGAKFDLILCDLMMPHLTGREVFQRAVAARPELGDRFVFMTGGVTNLEAREFLASVPNETLEKPFVVAHLLNIAARAVEPPTARSPGDNR